MKFIPTSDIQCPKFGFLNKKYRVGCVGHSNIESSTCSCSHQPIRRCASAQTSVCHRHFRTLSQSYIGCRSADVTMNDAGPKPEFCMMLARIVVSWQKCLPYLVRYNASECCRDLVFSCRPHPEGSS